MKFVSEVITLKQAYLRYAESFPKGRVKSAKTALVRYLLPYPGLGLNFHVDANKPLSPKQVSEGLDLAQTLKLEIFSDIDRTLSWQEKVFIALSVNSNVRGVFKFYLKHFLVWCQEQGWLQPKQPDEWTIPVSSSAPTRRHNRGNLANYPVTSRRSALPFRVKPEQLSRELQSDLKNYEAFWTEVNYSAGVRPIPREVEEITYELCFRLTLQFLGWLSLDKLDYYERMRQNAYQKRNENSAYESDWLLVDIDPPMWLKELHRRYPPIPLQGLKLENLVSVVKVHYIASMQSNVEDELQKKAPSEAEDEIELCIAELQAELKAKSVTLSFGLGLKLGTLIAKNKSVAHEVKQLNQIIQKEKVKEDLKAAALDAATKVSQLFNDFVKWSKYQYNPLEKVDGYRISTNSISSRVDSPPLGA